MASAKSVVIEIGVFSLGLGCLLAMISVVGASTTDDTAISVPLGIAGVLNALSGDLVLVYRKKFAIVLSIVAGALIAVAYFAGLLLSGGGLEINVIVFVVAAIPVLLVVRGIKAFDEIQNAKARRKRKQKRRSSSA